MKTHYPLRNDPAAPDFQPWIEMGPALPLWMAAKRLEWRKELFHHPLLQRFGRPHPTPFRVADAAGRAQLFCIN